jgi:hypothetical protein
MESTSGKTAKEQKVDDCSDDPAHPGKSPIVVVSFTTPPDHFEFSCHEVTIRTKGKVQLHRASKEDKWIFVRVNGLPESEFEVTIGGDGKTVTILDKYKTPNTSFPYTVTVRDEFGEEHTSPGDRPTPPMIRNR